jgi:hypothetical protein
MKKPALVLTAALVAGMFASAQNSMPMNAAYVRVVHASPDAPAVDVYLDGKRTVAGAEFKAVTPSATCRPASTRCGSRRRGSRARS